MIERACSGAATNNHNASSSDAIARPLLQAFADAPDRFLDPVTYTLMADPVVMPTSGASIERATILRHLMSDPRDPISRQPLQASQLQDNVALQEEISAWKAAQRQQLRDRLSSPT